MSVLNPGIALHNSKVAFRGSYEPRTDMNNFKEPPNDNSNKTITDFGQRHHNVVEKLGTAVNPVTIKQASW